MIPILTLFRRGLKTDLPVLKGEAFKRKSKKDKWD